jgi:hypothetical protein
MNLGNTSITAPTNGFIHVTLTGYLTAYNNNTAVLAIGNAPYGTQLSSTVVGALLSGSTLERHVYSITTQAVISANAGSKYTFYATAYRNTDDAALLSLWNVRLVAIFYAT